MWDHPSYKTLSVCLFLTFPFLSPGIEFLTKGTPPHLDLVFMVMLKGIQSKGASWPENRKCANIDLCWLWWIHHCLYQRSTLVGGGGGGFASNLSSSAHSHIGLLFTNEEQKKGWLMTYLIHLPPMSALFMTSLTQTAGHKMAELTCFDNCQSWILRIEEQNFFFFNCCVSNLYSIPINRACAASSLSVSCNRGERRGFRVKGQSTMHWNSPLAMSKD